MGLRYLLSILFLVCSIAPGLCQEAGLSPKERSWRTVFLGPDQAVIIEVRVLSDEGPQSRRRKLAEMLLARFDSDKDGQLSAMEAALLPAGARLSGTPAGEAWKLSDQTPADGILSLDELTDFVNRQLGEPFQITVPPPRLSQSVRLVDRVDADHDHAVSIQELQESMPLLRQTDLDDDEAVSVGELQPYPRRAGQRPPDQQTAETPLIAIDLDAGVQTGVERILKSYGHENSLVALSSLGGDAVKWDLDHDGALAASELSKWLKESPPEVTFTSVLRKGRPSSVEVQASAAGEPQKGSRVAATVGGAAVEVAAQNNKFEQTDASRMYGIRFLMSDKDKNGYLDEMEFSGLQLPAAFSDVDVNGDKMLYRDEMTAFVSYDAIAIQSRIELTVADEGKTLFELLDSNVDRRLTPRELQEGFDRLGTVDRNHDGRIAQSELESRYRFTFSYGRNQIFTPNTPGMNSPVTARIRNVNSGPPWYQRMDRNQDGDITWREFLGTREQFEKLDHNGDGLISRNEAEEATSASQSPEGTRDAR